MGAERSIYGTMAMVLGPVWGATPSAPSCAAPSIPSASPETMTSPSCANWAANRLASFNPCAVGLREPTIAMHARSLRR